MTTNTKTCNDCGIMGSIPTEFEYGYKMCRVCRLQKRKKSILNAKKQCDLPIDPLPTTCSECNKSHPEVTFIKRQCVASQGWFSKCSSCLQGYKKEHKWQGDPIKQKLREYKSISKKKELEFNDDDCDAIERKLRNTYCAQCETGDHISLLREDTSIGFKIDNVITRCNGCKNINM